MDFDLAILGGGPAGLACALRAADLGLTVLLCEARPAALERGGAFDKPCGEGIMPEGARVLTMLGVTPIERRPFAGVRYHVAGAAPLEVDFAEPGAACWRGDLDQALRDAARLRPAIRLERGRAEAEQRADGGHRIHIGAADFAARWLAVADGAHGTSAPWLREPARARAQPRRRVGARARFAERGRLDRVEIHFGAGVDVYLTPLPRGAINVVVLSEKDVHARRSAQELIEFGLRTHPSARRHLGGALHRAESRALGLPRPRRWSDGDSFLLGDAGGAVDPILGAGVAVALRSGVQAAECAHARAVGASAQAVARRFARLARAERRSRDLLARGLRFASRHDAFARAMARFLHAAPALAGTLGRVASGVDADAPEIHVRTGS
jgi:flavin-dependent dehydrogenase